MAFTKSVFLLSVIPLLSLCSAQRIPFAEVTSSVGISQPSGAEQFGGPTVADLDGDGHYDLILTYHNKHPLRIFYGSASGRFTRKSFTLKTDVHGVSVAQRTARSKERLMVISPGGGRGSNLRPPDVFLAKPDRSLTVTNNLGLGRVKTRGRIAVFMDMAMKSRSARKMNGGGPDVLFINFLGNSEGLFHFAYENVMGNFILKTPKNIQTVNEERAIVTDIDNDGVMELVHFSIFRVFKLTAPFTFKDITSSVAPGLRRLSRTVAAVVELDFNNDGNMDLYLARANSNLVTPRGPPNFPETTDVLLMNRNGRYVDVSNSMGIPKGTNSMGVSAEDFNNDGFVDLVVTTFEGNDFLLLNKGGRGFSRVDLPEVSKPSSTRGHNVMAVDYNRDGRVDLLFAQGFRKEFFGGYRLMKNSLAIGANSHYLHVRVGNEPSGASTSLNAIVTVHIGNQKLTRRVGGRGAGLGGQSYIDTVHFGLGGQTKVSKVTVKWTTGAQASQTNVSADRMISFGDL